MSRKDSIDNLFMKKPVVTASSPARSPDRVRTGAISAMGSSLHEMAENAKQVTKLQQQLAEGDPRLQTALRKLGGLQQLTPGDRLRPGEQPPKVDAPDVPPGHYSWDQLGDYRGLAEVAKVLQTKIQEAILAGALQDADEPVPTEYKGLVEKYYRTLSDDLR